MKYLLIEDDSNKSKQIIDFIYEKFSRDTVELRKSYQSGLKEIFKQQYDLILLDMQLPTFDIKSGEDGYRFRKLAGLDILSEIKRKKRLCKVIIVTQFETFGEGEYHLDLAGLKSILSNEFSGIYIDAVYYHAAQTKWKEELERLINNINTNNG